MVILAYWQETTGADWTESDGSRGAFVGAYIGTAQ